MTASIRVAAPPCASLRELPVVAIAPVSLGPYEDGDTALRGQEVERSETGLHSN
jgi:hypothetical protein